MQENKNNQNHEILVETAKNSDNDQENTKDQMSSVLDDITGVCPQDAIAEKLKSAAAGNINKNEYCPETKKALTTLQNLTGVIIHNINNLLAPFSLNMAKVEMYIEAGKTEQLKKDLPDMVNSTELHLNAVLESLRILYDNISADKSKVEYWDGVDIKNEMKLHVDKIIKPGK